MTKNRNETVTTLQAALNSRDTNLTGETFVVICTNPSRSAACPACDFTTAEWTESDAMAQFAADYSLDAADIAVED